MEVQNDVQAQKHWDAKYEGEDGAVAHARRAFNTCSRDEYIPLGMAYASTLIAAYNSARAKSALLSLMFWRNNPASQHKIALGQVVDLILREQNYRRKLTHVDKDVMVAALNILGGEEVLAVDLARDVVEDPSAPKGIHWLTSARITTMKLVKEPTRREYRFRVQGAVRDKYIQRDLGWKTINRLARMIGDVPMVLKSARIDGSKDIKLKSYAWVVAHFLFLV